MRRLNFVEAAYPQNGAEHFHNKYVKNGRRPVAVVAARHGRGVCNPMRVYLSKNSYLPFCEMLQANGIGYSEFNASPGKIYAAGYMVEIIGATALVATPLATVLVAWLNSRTSRKAQIDNGGFLTGGMSKDATVELLAEAQRLLILDEEKDEPPR